MVQKNNAKFLKASNFLDIEKLSEKICESEEIKLQIPNSLSYSGGFGIEGAALQLLATWLRKPQEHILHTAIKDYHNPDHFVDLCNSFFGLCALRLSDKIWSSEKSIVDLPTALKPAIPIFGCIRREDFKNAFKGMYLTIPSIKSPSISGEENKEFYTPLYNGENVVDSRKFLELTHKAIDVLIPQPSSRSRIDDSIVSHLSEIIRELFTNTHRHARTDVHGNPLRKNFRGVIFNFVTLSSKRLSELTKSGGGNLTLFVADWMPDKNQSFRAIDITVVDSGPGFARRWKGTEDLNFELEQEAIVECFQKHNSTNRSDSSGSGLSNVLNDLKALRGWFRLRTGRAQVERSFFDNKGSDSIQSNDITKMKTFMEGSVFNIVIPLQSLIKE